MAAKKPIHMTSPPPADDAAPALSSRLIWLCVSLGLVLAAAVLWNFGWSIWTGLVIGLLIACPLILVWAVLKASGGRVRGGPPR